MAYPTAGAVPNTIIRGYGYQSMTLSTPGGIGYSYVWSQAGPVLTGLSCNTCPSPVFTPIAEGTYTFSVTKTETLTGCSSTCTIQICVIDARALSPNNMTVKVYTCLNGVTSQIAVPAVEAQLRNNPAIRLGKCSSVCGSAKGEEEESVIVEISNDPEFKVRVYPNPFANQFRINIESSSDENLSIRIFDVLGQLIEKQGNIAYSTDVTIGSNLARGVYILEVSQGDKVDLIRIVKSE